MERRFLALAGMALAVSCGITEIETGNSTVDDGIWIRPETGTGSSEKAACLMTAFDWKDSFDWTAGDSYNVKCSITVIENGYPLMRIPVGDGYETSGDPDRHRLMGGHLYTDCTSGQETVIKCDGNTLFRYPGTERIVGMVVENGSVYTLGVPLAGEGFTYRKNGEPLLAKHSGYAFERLGKDAGNIFFAYCQVIETENGTAYRHYMVRDGVEKAAEIPERADKVWDMTSRDGEDCLLCSSTLDRSTYFVKSENVRLLDLPKGAEMLYGRFLKGGPGVCIEGMFTDISGRRICGLWMDGNEYRLFDNGMTISASCTSDSGICCALNPSGAEGSGIIFKDGRTHYMPAGYKCMGINPMTSIEGRLYVGLSSFSGEPPLIWEDGAIDTLRNINGYICTASGNH